MGLTRKELYTTDINFLANVFAILGHPARISIIYMLRNRGSATVGEIAESIQLAQSTISEHIKILRDINLITGQQAGTAMHYRLHEEMWPALKDMLASCAEEF